MAKKKPAKVVPQPVQIEAAPAALPPGAIHAPAVPQIHGLVPMEGNIVNCGGIQIIWAGNDCTVVYTRPRPGMATDGKPAKHALAEVVAMIQFSAGTMKDMSIVIQDAVRQYEEKYGVVETLFTKARAAKKKSSTTKH